MGSHPTSAPTTLVDLLDRSADARPGAMALADGRARLDWRTYRERADRVAAALSVAGVAPGDRVGVSMPKSVDAFVAVHGVLRAGAIVVPVDRLAPAEYGRSVLIHSGACAVVSSQPPDRLAEVLDGTDVTRVVDPTGDLPAPVTAPTGRRPDDDAYIIFTSGSTGRPKGIVHTHASALAYADAAVETYDLGPGDVLTNIAPLHFDQSTFELYAAPLAGSATIVVPDGLARFPASVAALVADERATVWYSVPFAISQLVERGALAEHDVSSLRWVLYGGEPFPPAALRRAMAAIPSARFSNVYGPAELNQCTYHHLDAPPPDEMAIPIGRAWSAAQVMLVDDDDRRIDGTGEGELLVAGPTMMRAYWNAPDLTGAAVVERDGARWYRTGDRVRRRPDGDLVFQGRTDHQVKVRGHRIELEAVDAALADHPAVEACAALVDRRGDDRVVAVVAPAPDASTERDLIRHARARLPGYAVPTRIVGLGTLPRTGTGKVDRRAAERIYIDLDDRRDDDPAP